MAAAFLPVLPEGQHVLQYSRNLDNGEWVVLMKRPAESAQGSGLLAPFTFDVWMLILVSLIAVGPIIYLLIWARQRLCPIDEKNKVFPLRHCVWFVYGALLKQGSTLSPVSGKQYYYYNHNRTEYYNQTRGKPRSVRHISRPGD